MASRLEQIARAMRSADAAGDSVTAEILGRAYREEQGGPAASETYGPWTKYKGSAPAAAASGLPPLPPGFELEPAGGGPQLRAGAPSDGSNWWKDAPVVQDASGQRYDEGGVPIGGKPLPKPRFAGIPVGQPRFPGIPVFESSIEVAPNGTSDGDMPPLPLGFVLDEPQAGPWTKYQQNAAADGDAAPAPPKFGGATMNATAGVNESLYGLAGAPVDLVHGGMNLASRGINAVAGTQLPQIPENSLGGSRWIGETLGAVRPELDPQNTEARSFEDRLARGVGQGVAGTVAPAGVAAGLARTGIIGPQMSATAQALFGRAGSLPEAALGAAGGAGTVLGREIAPQGYEDLAGLAGGLAAGGLGAAAVSGGHALAAPFTAGGRDRLAGGRLAAGASDPVRLREALAGQPDALVPGSQPTTFQRTGDLGLGVMEKDAANRSPEPFAMRRADQNQARVDELRNLAPGGAPERVAAVLRQRLDDLDAETDRLMGEASGQARGSVSAIGAPTAPEVAGGSIRQSLEAARAQAKAQERSLWQAVDPDGTMTIGLGGTRESARGVMAELSPMAQPMSEAERQIYDAIGGAGETVPLRAMRDLQSNLKTAMRAERLANGESPVYRRMSIVSAGIARDFDSAITGRATQEAQAVAAGAMRFEDTLLAQIQREQEGWVGGQQATARAAGGGESAVEYGAGRSSAVPGAPRAEGEARGGSAPSARDPRLAGAEPAVPFDRAAQERLTAANASTRERVQTFDNATLGPVRQRPAASAPYTMPAGVVPARIFNATPKSPEALGQLRAAIGDQAATDAIQGYAVGEVLRIAGRPDGTIDPARLATWRRAHANALGALPGLDARLADAGRASAAIADVAATRQQARKAAQQGALGRLLQVDAPEDVTRIVGGAFSAQDATARLQAIREAVGSDPEAAEGLRRAVVDHIAGRFVGNVEVATSGTGGMRSDGFQTFVRRNAGALRAAGLETRDLRILDSIAADLQRSGRSIASVKNPAGSDTAQNFMANLRGNSPFAATARLLAAPGAAGVGVGVASGTTTGLAAGAAAGLFAAMRNAGLRTVDDLVTDALLNPERARILLSKVPTGDEASVVNALARSYANTAARILSQDEDRKPDDRRAEMRGPMYLRRLSGSEGKNQAVADALGLTFDGPAFASMSPVAKALAGRLASSRRELPSELVRAVAGRMAS